MQFGTGPLARLIRRWRLDHNPLRRACDRTETVLLGALLAAFLAIAPFAANAAGSWAYATSAREAQTQRATIRQVPATLMEGPGQEISYPGGGYEPADVDARWRAPDGQVRTGVLVSPLGATAGSTVPVWVDRAGHLANPPLARTQLVYRAQLAEGTAVGAIIIALIVACWLAHRVLHYRRMAAWDSDWLATAPQWHPRMLGAARMVAPLSPVTH
jgi:hypothetical protein